MKLEKIGRLVMTPEGLRKLADALEVIHPGKECSVSIWRYDTIEKKDYGSMPVWIQLDEESGIIHL